MLPVEEDLTTISKIDNLQQFPFVNLRRRKNRWLFYRQLVETMLK